MKICPPDKRSQEGVALLILFLILFSISATIFLSSVNTNAVEVREQQDIRYEMEKAKQALISYAVNYQFFGFDHDGDTETDDEGPGRFPCPDIDNDGTPDNLSTECTDYVRGRLPVSVDYGTSTFSFNNTNFSGIDQQFWYVVSPTFKDNATTGVNAYSSGDLSIDGTSGYAAVIIAPGEALSFQDRASSDTTASNYLEQDNLSGTAFINSYATDPDIFNDQVIGITFAEIKSRLINMAAQQISRTLDDYYDSNSVYPQQSNFTTFMNNNAPAWITGNPQDNWLSDITYYYDYSPPVNNKASWQFASCPSNYYYMNYGSALFQTGTC